MVEETGITRLLKQLRQLSQELSADRRGSDVLRRTKLYRKLVSQTDLRSRARPFAVDAEARGDNS